MAPGGQTAGGRVTWWLFHKLDFRSRFFIVENDFAGQFRDRLIGPLPEPPFSIVA